MKRLHASIFFKSDNIFDMNIQLKDIGEAIENKIRLFFINYKVNFSAGINKSTINNKRPNRESDPDLIRSVAFSSSV